MNMVNGLYMIKAVGKTQTLTSGPRVKTITEGHEVSYLIDTGSSANVLDQYTYDRLGRNKPELRPCEDKYYGYSADKPITMVGQFDTMIKHGSNETKARFVVSAGRHECLMCSNTACELGIITIKLTLVF